MDTLQEINSVTHFAHVGLAVALHFYSRATTFPLSSSCQQLKFYVVRLCHYLKLRQQH